VDLLYVARVVQDDEDVLSGQYASVHAGPGVKVVWYVPGW
jgi:hypothetical protein